MLGLKGFVVSCLLLCGALAITLRDGRYEDVYIVIQDSIQDDLKILYRIQDIFTNASQLLFNATKYQAYFGKIKVVIPRSWSSQSQYKLLPALSTLKTYINIDEGRIKIPHVRSRTNTCGEEGWYMYMYLTPSFLLETDITEWGKHENVIVHEWGHLRWGLFDEYPDSIVRQPAFYQHAGEWKPVKRYNFKSQTIGDSFQRTVVTEELYISNYDYDTSGTSDVIAPGRITDLEINNIETATTQYGENRNFTITWTATEDDKNSGKATSYEMKISNNSFYLRDSFESAEALNMTNVTLSPQAVGSTEALKIVVDAEESFTETMYFAVRAVDEAGNVGPVSNIVPIVIARGFRASGEQGYAVTDTDDDIVIEDISPSKTSDEYDVKSIIVGVSVAGAVLLLAAGAFLYVKKSVTTKAAVTDSQLSICTNNHSMTDVEPFNPNQNEKTSTNSSPVLQTIEFPSPFTPSQIKELNTQDFTRPQTPDSDHRYIDTKLETKGTDETVVDIEDETSEFGDPDDYITETTTFTFPVCKVPFHMTNKAFPLKTSTEQEGVKKYHTVDDMSDQNVSERNHSTLPALPFATHENMDRSHPPPNMALHIFKPDAYGPGKKPYSFPAPFSGVSSTLDMSATMIADLETTDDILDNKDIQTADNEIVSGTTDREMHKYRIDINESKNEYLSCYNDNGMPDSVETGSSVTEHSACNDVHTDVCSRDDEVNCESKKSSESEIDETSFYNKEYTKKIEGSLYAGNFEVGSNNASYTEENEVIFRNEAYSVEDVISSRNANTENMEVKAEIECNGRKVGIDSDNES